MGVEDVEAEIDRIGLQLEDPRFHPDRMTAATDAMATLGGQALPGMSMEGPGAVPGADQAMTDSMAAAGVPGQAGLAQSMAG
jgi:hypothetical protein